MTKEEFRENIKGLLEKYDFKYNRLVVRKDTPWQTGYLAWIYFTSQCGNKDYHIISSYCDHDKYGSYEFAIRSIASLEGYCPCFDFKRERAELF